MTLRAHLREQEKAYLLHLLERHGNELRPICSIAGISVATLYRKLPKVKMRCSQRTKRFTIKEVPGVDRIEVILRFFGVQIEPCADFWVKHTGRLDAMHYDARKSYLAMARRLHPDSGGSISDAERLAKINAAWDRLEGAFRKHGWEG